MNRPLPALPRPALRLVAMLCCLSLGLPLPIAATTVDRDDTVAAPKLQDYVQECAACHMAYPPGLLPAQSWARLMADLSRHFGTDASLDAATQLSLSAWLADHAGTFRRLARDPGPPPQERISLSTWFVQKHREIDARVWRRPAVGSAARCNVCHSGAEQGQFSEHEVYMPK